MLQDRIQSHLHPMHHLVAHFFHSLNPKNKIDDDQPVINIPIYHFCQFSLLFSVVIYRVQPRIKLAMNNFNKKSLFRNYKPFSEDQHPYFEVKYV